MAGLVLASIYVYRYYFIPHVRVQVNALLLIASVLLLGLLSCVGFCCVYGVQMPDKNMFQCKVLFDDALYAPLFGRYELEESVGIFLEQNYEKISVPVPHFGGSDPADIIHDFHRVRSRRCPLKPSYVIPLADPAVFSRA